MLCRIYRAEDIQKIAPRRKSLKSGGYGGLGSIRGPWGPCSIMGAKEDERDLEPSFYTPSEEGKPQLHGTWYQGINPPAKPIQEPFLIPHFSSPEGWRNSRTIDSEPAIQRLL